MSADDENFSNEEAARVVQREEALQAEPTGPEDENKGIDDDASTPDRAVSDEE